MLAIGGDPERALRRLALGALFAAEAHVARGDWAAAAETCAARCPSTTATPPALQARLLPGARRPAEEALARAARAPTPPTGAGRGWAADDADLDALRGMGGYPPLPALGARLLEQPRQPAVLQHAAAGLLLRAVAEHVVLVVHRLDRRAAARARLALVAVDQRAAAAACRGSGGATTSS